MQTPGDGEMDDLKVDYFRGALYLVYSTEVVVHRYCGRSVLRIFIEVDVP